MNRFRTCIHALVVAAALAAGPAASSAVADHGVPYRDATFDRYLEIAHAQWGGAAPVCSGGNGETIAVHAVQFDDPNPEVIAVAELPGCRMWLDRDFWPARESQIDCTIIAHEWGHLLGHDHSPDRRSLMYEAPEFGAPGCGVFQSVVALSEAAAYRSHARPAARRCVRRAGARRKGPRGNRGRARCGPRTRAGTLFRRR